MKLLITGGAGFIGSHLVDACIAQGHDVSVIDDLSYGKHQNLAAAASRILFHEASILDMPALMSAAKGCEAIFHLAAVSSVAESMTDPARVHQVNATGVLNVLEAARATGARVVFSSSAAVYGNQSVMPVDENCRTNPISLYGGQKLLGEHYAQTYFDLFGLPIVCLRYFNVYGPRQDPASPYSGVISIFADRIPKGDPVTIFGDGHQIRDFVYVEDVVRANLLACASPEAVGHIFNVGTGKATSILQVAEELKEATGSKSEIRFDEARPGDIRESRADIGRASGMLGYSPSTMIDQGLRKLLASLKA